MTATRGDARTRTPQPDAGQAEELTRTVEVVTPESTLLSFELAGLGSRFAALLVDSLVQGAALVVLGLLAVVPLALGRGWAPLAGWLQATVWPLALLLAWLLLWGYFVAFETWWNGQTPGKRALGLRVVRAGGGQVAFAEVALRNLLRYVDLLPVVSPYLLGVAVLLGSRQSQRIGDLVAGTLVIRERRTPWVAALVAGQGEPATPDGPRFTPAQVDLLTTADADLLAAFLRRREALLLPTRQELAGKLAAPLGQRLVLPQPAPEQAEAWLEALWLAWQARRRR